MLFDLDYGNYFYRKKISFIFFLEKNLVLLDYEDIAVLFLKLELLETGDDKWDEKLSDYGNGLYGPNLFQSIKVAAREFFSGVLKKFLRVSKIKLRVRKS